MLNNKDTVIKLANVSFGYEPKKQIINNVSFSITKGQHIAIIGPNASGKTTLAKIIAGLYKPTSGTIYFNNNVINKDNVKDLKQAIGIVFENPDSQLIGFSPEDDIAFGLENKQTSQAEMKKIISEVSNIVGITNLLKLDAKQLSGGQKQKVAIASILALDPQVIIVDEATNMLDSSSKQSINSLINLLKNKYSKTIISISHEIDDTIHADKILVLNKGEVFAYDKPQNIYELDLGSIGLDKPFAYNLSKKIKGVKPTIFLDKLVKEIKDAK